MRCDFVEVGKIVAGGTQNIGGGKCAKQKERRYMMTIEISTAIIISVLSLGFSVFIGLKNSKRTDTKDIEDRVKDNTKINMKLDNINSTTQDIKSDLSSMRNDIKAHNDKIIVLEQSCKQAHKRLDEIINRLNLDLERDREV